MIQVIINPQSSYKILFKVEAHSTHNKTCQQKAPVPSRLVRDKATAPRAVVLSRNLGGVGVLRGCRRRLPGGYLRAGTAIVGRPSKLNFSYLTESRSGI